jgi:DNA invertase Pin-like site-specific DNA recombinase
MPTMVGYARCSTDAQDLTAQRTQLGQRANCERERQASTAIEGHYRSRHCPTRRASLVAARRE